MTTTAGSGETLQLQWADNSLIGNAKATDNLLAVVYNPASELYLISGQAATRADGTATLQLPTEWEGDEVEGWAAFVREDCTMASTGAYLGHLLIT